MVVVVSGSPSPIVLTWRSFSEPYAVNTLHTPRLTKYKARPGSPSRTTTCFGTKTVGRKHSSSARTHGAERPWKIGHSAISRRLTEIDSCILSDGGRSRSSCAFSTESADE